MLEVVVASNKSDEENGNSELKNIEQHAFELEEYRMVIVKKKYFYSTFCFTDVTDTGLGKNSLRQLIESS